MVQMVIVEACLLKPHREVGGVTANLDVGAAAEHALLHRLRADMERLEEELWLARLPC